MTTPNIDEPKTISEILALVFWAGQHNAYPDTNNEPEMSVAEALKDVERIMEDVIGADEKQTHHMIGNDVNSVYSSGRNDLRKSQRQRLKERL